MTRTVLAFLALAAPAARAQDVPPDAGPPRPAHDEEPYMPNEGIPDPDPKVAFAVATGVGVVGEKETGHVATYAFRVQGAMGLPAHLRIVGSFADGFHDQTYLSKDPSTDGSTSQSVVVFEQTLNMGLGVDWDIGPYLPWALEGVHIRPGLAPSMVVLDDESFSSWLFALRLSAAVEVPLAKRLSLTGSGAFSPGLAHTTSTLSTLGVPVHAWDASVGLSEKFGHFAVNGTWNVDGTLFEHTQRVRHLAMVGLSFAK